MLISVGSLLFSCYLFSWKHKKVSVKQEKTYGITFILLGIIASVFGFSIYINEPIPPQYIEVYGVGYFVYGLLLLVGGWCMVLNWDKKPASYLAGIGGLILLWSARTIYYYGLSKSPLASTLIFALSGFGALGTTILAHKKQSSTSLLFVWLVLLAFFIVGLLTLYSGLNAQFGHVGRVLAEAAK